MEKSKRSKAEGQLDRLSELPDSLIFHILSFMAMTDVVQTTILSKRWKNLWTTVSTLNFKDFKRKPDDTDDLFLNRVGNFITRVLIFWRGARIQKFNIQFGKRFNKSIYDDIDLSLQFAKEYKPEALCVSFGEGSIQPTPELYPVPQCLYSCSSLKRLSLQGCHFNLPIKNVSWNQLKFLSIYRCYGLTEDLVNKVLSGSPQLGFFVLCLVENIDNLTIKSTSLRVLAIRKHYVHHNPPVDTELRILAPNLEGLILLGVPYTKFWMNDVPRLTIAYLMFDGPFYYSHQLFSGIDFVGETLRQILPTIQHVETVHLSDCCIKALGDMKKKNMLSPFPNVKELVLKGYFEEYEQVVYLLEIFPKLETLTIRQVKGSKKYHENQPHGCRESVKFEANLPNFFLQQLRTIVITLAEGEDSILPLIETLLKYTSKLKKLVFRVEERAPPSNSLLLALLKMPRSSPTAQLIFSTIPAHQ